MVRIFVNVLSNIMTPLVGPALVLMMTLFSSHLNLVQTCFGREDIVRNFGLKSLQMEDTARGLRKSTLLVHIS